MSHSQNKELDRIPLGSMDFYVVEYTGSIPDDATFEIEKNMIGRTKNGATVTYGAEWHTAESDDGKAKNAVSSRKLQAFHMVQSLGTLTHFQRLSQRQGLRKIQASQNVLSKSAVFQTRTANVI